MVSHSKQALIWRARRLARSLDWFSLGGIVLVVLSLALYFYTVRPLDKRVAMLENRVAEANPSAASRPKATAPASPKEQLAIFYERLADARQAPEIAGRLHRYARSAGLTLERGEYRPQVDASGRFVRYQIVLPVNGTYRQIRSFIADAMRDMPGLALDGIDFKREGADLAALQAQLRFTAFLRKTT